MRFGTSIVVSRGANMSFGGVSAGINSFRTRMLLNYGGADSTTMQKTPLFARSEGYHVPYKAQRGGFCFSYAIGIRSWLTWL